MANISFVDYDNPIPDGLVVQTADLVVDTASESISLFIWARSDQANINDWTLTDYDFDQGSYTVVIDSFASDYAKIALDISPNDCDSHQGYIVLTATDDNNIVTNLRLNIRYGWGCI